MRVVMAILLVLVLCLQTRLWFGEGSFAHVSGLRRQIGEQQAINTQLIQRNQRLAAQVREFKEGLDSVEEHARQQLGMVREGETFFQLIEPGS